VSVGPRFRFEPRVGAKKLALTFARLFATCDDFFATLNDFGGTFFDFLRLLARWVMAQVVVLEGVESVSGIEARPG
jgi:hypothetical protein